jgi:hypothetical protein
MLANINNIYRLIFRLPLLKYYKISLNSCLNLSLSVASNKQFSPIEYLVFDKSCTCEEFIILLSYTSRLNRLVCQTLIKQKNNISTNISMIFSFSNLTHMIIDKCCLSFKTFEIFTKKISFQLIQIMIHLI